MKILNFKEFLNEGLNFDVLKKKLSQYLGTVDEQIINSKLNEFENLVTINGKVISDIYIKWLVDIYTKGNLKEEDFYKAQEYLSIFHKNKAKLKERDILKFSTLPQLYHNIKEFDTETPILTNSETIKKIKAEETIKFDFPEWTVIIPKTKEAAKFYGKGTKWCTSAEKEEDNKFDLYSEGGKKFLFMFMHKTKKDENGYQLKYQLWLNDDSEEPSQFMDALDDSTDPRDVLSYELFKWCMTYQGYTDISVKGLHFAVDTGAWRDKDIHIIEQKDLELTDLHDIINFSYDGNTTEIDKESILNILDGEISDYDYYANDQDLKSYLDYDTIYYICNAIPDIKILDTLNDDEFLNGKIDRAEYFLDYLERNHDGVYYDLLNLLTQSVESGTSSEKVRIIKKIANDWYDDIKTKIKSKTEKMTDYQKALRYMWFNDEYIFLHSLIIKERDLDNVLTYPTLSEFFEEIQNNI